MHRSFAIAIASLAVASLAACDLETTIELDDDANGSVELELDITGACSGTGTRETAGGSVTTWTKTIIGDVETGDCRIDLEWSGSLVDLAELRAKAVDSCNAHGCNPDKLALDLTLTITKASLVAGVESMTPDQVRALSARVTSGAATLFAIDKLTPLPLTAGPDPAVKAALEDAYLRGVKLPAAAEASLSITMADLRRIQRAAPTGTLAFDFTSHLDGELTIGVDDL